MFFPLLEEIPYHDPFQSLIKLQHQSWPCLLESANTKDIGGRYSFIGVDPFWMLQEKQDGNPFEILKNKLQLYSCDVHKSYPPFQGGLMGFFSYDLVHYLEQWPRAGLDEMQFPDISVGLYDVVMAFDHQEKTAFIFSTGFPELELVTREQRARQRISWLKGLLQKQVVFSATNITLAETDIISNFTKDNYQRAVDHVKNYILEGDIFEANISQCFKASLPAVLSPLEIYSRLRQVNPAPFAALLLQGDIALISASPERFIKKSAQELEVRPIKGTRPRGKTSFEDQQLAHDLLHSEKDYAENIMIVDLMRNDLSKVCEPTSVIVEKLCGLESFSAVHHLVSVIKARLQKNKTPVELLSAIFPGGSITGAPKLRAMEIISEIEPTARGAYCGCLGYIGFNGDMDLAMTIRTFSVKDNWISFQAGGAIVLDSDPAAEYQETLDKSAALKRVLCNDLSH